MWGSACLAATSVSRDDMGDGYFNLKWEVVITAFVTVLALRDI